MKAFPLAILAVLIVAFLSCQSFAQDGGAMIDEKNAAQDAAIAERRAVDEAQGAEIIDLKASDAAQSDGLKSLSASVESLEARVRALEEAGPVEPPVPPVDSWPAFLRNLDTGEKTPFEDSTLTAPEGKYTVQIGESDSEKLEGIAPFTSTVNGSNCGPERNPVYHICGDNNALALNTGENAVTIKAEGNGETKALTIVIEASAPPTGPPDNGNGGGGGSGGALNFLTQVGPWFPAPFNIEEPFLNIFNANFAFWQGGGLDLPALIEKGYIDRDTLLPTGKAGAPAIITSGFFETGVGNEEYLPLKDGTYILELEAEGECSATIRARHSQAALQRQTGPCRLELTRDYAGGRSINTEQFLISNVRGRITAMRLYRAEHEDLIRAGKIYNPAFLAEACRYDILRTMDLQSANGAVIRSVDDQIGMESPFWGSADWSNARGDDWRRWPNTKQGMPIEAALRLGVECDAMVWFQAPLTLGAPTPFWDTRPQGDRPDLWADAFAKTVQPIAPQVLESKEWDRYADAFVDALIKSGYPEDRTLYVSLANEVWNWVAHYFLTTKYAQHMGIGLEDYLSLDNSGAREAYGAALSRFKLALDEALAERGRSQDYVIAVEGQAAYAALTGLALRGAKAYMTLHGERWEDHAPAFGVSAANYHSYEDQIRLLPVDFSDPAKVAEMFINGPADVLGTKASIIELWRAQVREGEPYGVKFIGGYEGGPHFARPWDRIDGEVIRFMTQDDYEKYIWGDYGAQVNFEINCALAQEFPGAIISNYVLAGMPGGQPWFEGPLGDNGPYEKSWDALNALRKSGEGCRWTP